MSTHMHYLTVADNFFGSSFATADSLRRAWQKLSYSQMFDLVERYQEFEAQWAPSATQPTEPTFLFGKAHEIMGNSKSWHPRYYSPTRNMTSDKLASALLYMPKISIWLPSSPDPNKLLPPDPAIRTEWREAAGAGTSFHILCRLMELSPLRPLLEDGSVQTIPDAYYSSIKSHDLITLAELESGELGLRTILDQLQPFDNVRMSDTLETWAAINEHEIRYLDPLVGLNEDILVQSQINGHLMSCNDVMHALVAAKFDRESRETKESAWLNAAVSLPKLSNLAIDDLVRVRRNEDAFEVWRAALSRAIRDCEQSFGPSNMRQDEVSAAFNEVAVSAASILKSKRKSKAVSSLVEAGAISFLSGAIGSWFMAAAPSSAIGAGAVTSSLKLIYDLLKARESPEDRSLLRLFALLKTS
ncbi:hypothetical protein [Rhodopseudomonas sp. B29]|uniref:hypothetical protein n=1 Tax=Rhodopseudomonas sp. B29 TaxID=95607 RepID=UPI000347AD9A|nr:hypothetical protein [Rhodopseudomonas sp. B29]